MSLELFGKLTVKQKSRMIDGLAGHFGFEDQSEITSKVNFVKMQMTFEAKQRVVEYEAESNTESRMNIKLQERTMAQESMDGDFS